ncbi:MAG: efflux RND transporter periplasmic adaptor subunit [Giesbergeria sp.]|jgi:membrane fusion protein (multidrug efflux system)|nr:efflux RND transporter periplasmic adaptor subunit [Giesbergeria sp.]MBP6159541.1 efflux RND transporter periplasmic adaptor subunit [Giesbergeria sp.]MBP7083700.1 efflux RND transporter periplasmic adaptor subunit [Giesbergeria sp.]MBP9783982.1 efflux RND transporter periplasmic adaptor subunit [Giesbergeria sp.]MBP9894484.1 efflux RND transporter periplasmic adaptor subunit [Giesbergeria sp.]
MHLQPHDSSRPLAACAPQAAYPQWRVHLYLRSSALLFALLISGLLVAGCSDKTPAAGKAPVSAAREPTKVGVITLQAQAQTLTSALPGRTSAFMSADIRPQINGIVQKRLFTEGATVKAGQALYQIDAAPYQATEAAARAALAKAQAQARTAEVNSKRNAELVRIDAISRQAYDESLATAQQTASDVAMAQAALATARINLGYTRIVAPISGRTALSNVNAGGLVTANQTGVLTTISQLDPMYIDVTQSSSELLQLKRDLAAGRFEKLGEGAVRITILLEDGSKYAHSGRLQFAGVTVNPSTGAVTLRAVVPNPDGVLMPGMYVQTLLPTGVSSEALLVPQQAVTRDIAGKANVLVVGPDNKVARRAIEIDRAVGSRWLVSSGLAAGDTVVVDGFQRIKPGDTVAPQPVQLPGGGTRAPAAPAMAPGAAAVPAPSASNPAR